MICATCPLWLGRIDPLIALTVKALTAIFLSVEFLSQLWFQND
jgi:hypothetical protein